MKNWKLTAIFGGLIALYLVVVNSKGATSLLTAGTQGAANVTTALQGRSKV